MTIKYLELTPGCAPVINENGDAFDLKAAETITVHRFRAKNKNTENMEPTYYSPTNTLVKLGIAMKLPKGIVADLKPRSSTYKKWYLLQTNSVGLIDSSYCGNEDEWKIPVIATSTSHIHKGDRICQFELRPSQNAPWYVWLKWIFKRGIKFEKVDSLTTSGYNRGGFGEGTKHLD